MKKRAIFLLFLLEAFNSVSGQTNSPTTDFEDSIVESYLTYYSFSRERVYTHFNKSCYLPGESIWFKCYVFNPKTKRPSIITSNLIAELYNPDGKLLEQKILFVNQGVADNMFFLSHNSSAGRYTFRVYTNWMKNFDDSADFTSYLTVLGKQQQDTLRGEVEYDVQLLPESGTFLEGLTNKVAIKAIDINGQGVKLYGEIVDEKGATIQPFELNHLGMGSVLLDATPEHRLRCRVTLPDGRVAIYPLPDAEKNGVIAQVSQDTNRVVVNLSSNRQTLLNGQTFYLMIHCNGQVQQIASILLTPENTYHKFEFDRSELINGVNCLTVFNEQFKPVAERLFYVSNADIKGEVKIERIMKRDSITLNVMALDHQGNPVASNLSISVLPGGTTSSNFTNSLLAEVLLSSGLKGRVDNPNYYFEGQDPERLSALDNLLLTQGWRKYCWRSILDTTETLKYEIERGFTISGEVKGWNKGRSNAKKKVSLISFENGIFDITEPDSLGRFSFTNQFFPGLTTVSITALNEKGQNANKDVSSSVSPVYKADSTIKKPNNYLLPNKIADGTLPPSLISGSILIEEVKIMGARKEKPIASAIFQAYEAKTKEITEEVEGRYKRMEDILRQEFGVTSWFEYEYDEKVWHASMNRGINSINLQGDPIVIIDDIPIGDGSKYNRPLNYLFEAVDVSDIEAISVNKTGFGLGSRGVDGAIIIKTRTNPLLDKDKSTVKVNKVKVNGYSNPVAYYTPKYGVQAPEPYYINYATLFWQPNVVTNINGKANFTFEVPSGLNTLEVRIEGITDDGCVFLENKKLKMAQQ